MPVGSFSQASGLCAEADQDRVDGRSGPAGEDDAKDGGRADNGRDIGQEVDDAETGFAPHILEQQCRQDQRNAKLQGDRAQQSSRTWPAGRTTKSPSPSAMMRGQFADEEPRRRPGAWRRRPAAWPCSHWSCDSWRFPTATRRRATSRKPALMVMIWDQISSPSPFSRAVCICLVDVGPRKPDKGGGANEHGRGGDELAHVAV